MLVVRLLYKITDIHQQDANLVNTPSRYKTLTLTGRLRSLQLLRKFLASMKFQVLIKTFVKPGSEAEAIISTCVRNQLLGLPACSFPAPPQKI